MPEASANIESVPWPLLAIGAWITTVVILAALVYGITKAAINKSNAENLPQVLTAVTQLLNGVTSVFGRGQRHLPAPIVLPAGQEVRQAEQNGSITRTSEAA